MCEGLSKLSGPIPPHPMFLDSSSYVSFDRQNSARDSSLCQGPSKVSGPIQSDYKNDILNKFEDLNVDSTKVKCQRSKHLNEGSRMALLLELNGRTITPRTFKLREKPKNHMHDNRMKIKELMHKVKERETQKCVPVKALWKSEQYKEVNSKLKEMLQEQPSNASNSRKDFLRSHSSFGLDSARRPHSARPPSSTSENKPNQKSKDDIDFIQLNKKIAANLRIKRAPSVEHIQSEIQKREHRLENYEQTVKGKVPEYLKKRNEQIQREKLNESLNQPDPEQPPNHRKLPEEERLKTLKLLQDKQQSLINELNTLPIRNDTYRMVTHKNMFQKQLGEIEEAIKIFSKPKVFVKIEN